MLDELAELHGKVAAMEELFNRHAELLYTAHSNSRLSMALWGLESAIKSGKKGSAWEALTELKRVGSEEGAADGTISEVLEMLPKGTVEMCKTTVPTEAALQVRFDQYLGDLKAASFIPRNWGLLGHITGWCFG